MLNIELGGKPDAGQKRRIRYQNQQFKLCVLQQSSLYQANFKRGASESARTSITVFCARVKEKLYYVSLSLTLTAGIPRALLVRADFSCSLVISYRE